MSSPTNEGQLTTTPIAQPSDDGFFVDLDKCFNVWLNSLNKKSVGGSASSLNSNSLAPGFYIESVTGSNCDVTFEGVLQVEGHLSGSIRSLNGTLVMPEEGMIEADIEVASALINGWINGNITASDKVVLNSRARVLGNIKTPSLSINDGAVFEGACNFSEEFEPEEPKMVEVEDLVENLVAV